MSVQFGSCYRPTAFPIGRLIHHSDSCSLY